MRLARKVLRGLTIAVLFSLLAFLYIGLQGATSQGMWMAGMQRAIAAPIVRSTAEAPLRPTSPESSLSGSAVFAETPTGVHLEVNVENAPTGLHAFHVHQKGDCSDGGNAAGGHFNPKQVKHGFLPSDGFDNAHAGDLGNIVVGSDGTGRLSQTLEQLTLTGGEYALKNLAVILHEKPDDFGQPTGNAGGRIACGIISLMGS